MYKSYDFNNLPTHTSPSGCDLWCCICCHSARCAAQWAPGATPGSRSYNEWLVTLNCTHTCLIIPLIYSSKPKLSVSPSRPLLTQIPRMPMAFPVPPDKHPGGCGSGEKLERIVIKCLSFTNFIETCDHRNTLLDPSLRVFKST